MVSKSAGQRKKGKGSSVKKNINLIFHYKWGSGRRVLNFHRQVSEALVYLGKCSLFDAGDPFEFVGGRDGAGMMESAADTGAISSKLASLSKGSKDKH